MWMVMIRGYFRVNGNGATTTFESLGTPSPSCKMDGTQEETCCIVNTPFLNLNFRLFTCHFPQGLQHAHASAMSHNVWH
jgi:hypothetical protein